MLLTMTSRNLQRAATSRDTDDDDSAIRSTGHGGAPRVQNQSMEWSLRKMHKIDNSAHHFISNYYRDTIDETDAKNNRGNSVLEDQSAYEIFKTEGRRANKGTKKNGDSIWASLHAPLRTGIVDGKPVVFELVTDVTKKPDGSRKQRLKRRREIINSTRSPLETRLRFWLMNFNVSTLSISFVGVFVAMNAFFALLFYSLQDRCCGNPDMSFANVFAFCVQTSTTVGYGVLAPKGTASNFFVLILWFDATLLNTLFAGLLFAKFVTPVINIEFSDVMTLCNVNGVPCLSLRFGNADGYENPLTDINVRLTYSYQIPYVDHVGKKKFFRQSEELALLSSRQHGLVETWTLRHVLDETSPLFGLHFQEHPANKIYIFTLSVDAVQELTKATVNIQTEYTVDDIMIGHTFVTSTVVSEDGCVSISDYSKMSDTEPYPVWYPAKGGAYDTGELIAPTKRFKP